MSRSLLPNFTIWASDMYILANFEFFVKYLKKKTTDYTDSTDF
jgi:hypothetical protein